MGSHAATSLAEIDVAILAGGLGTRLRGVLGDAPKVLAPIAIGGRTRPFLDILLDWLAGQGARRIVLCLGHLADRVERHLAQVSRGDLSIVRVVEPGPLGTAGALRFAGSRLASDPIMVINGDTFVDADLGAMLARHRAAGASVTMLCARVGDSGRYGRVDIGADGTIRRFVEKDPTAGPGIINAGIYLLGRTAIDDIMGGAAASIERDVLERLPAGAIHAVVAAGRFIDIGTPESLDAASAVLADRP